MNSNSKYLFIFICLITSMEIASATSPGLRGRAERLYNSLNYAEAAELYLQLTDIKNPAVEDMEKLAECYRKMNKYKDSEIWYARIVKNTQSKPEDLFMYGEVLKANANYSNAKRAYQSYATKTKDKDRVKVRIAGCDSAKVWIASPTKHLLRNEDMVNTPFSEFGVFPVGQNQVYYVAEPSQNKEKKKIYGWTGNSYLRIFMAIRATDGSLIAPEIPDIPFDKAQYHVGPIATDSTGEVFLVTRTYAGKTKNRILIDGDNYSTQNMELFFQGKILGKWKNPEPFPYNNVEQYSVGHPTLSADENTLYFVSNMPGGQGGTDIWSSQKNEDGSWAKPQNLGNQINTPGDELFPFYSKDSVLFFSSTGLPGMGGLDIFWSRRSNNQWSKPVNMYFPINSPGDDFAFFLDKDQTNGYLSSNRENGMGGDDIYSFQNPKQQKNKVVIGIVYNKKNNLRLPEANVIIYDHLRNIVAKQDSKLDGGFCFQLNQPSDYSLHGAKVGYYPDTSQIVAEDWKAKDTIYVALYLDPLFEKGKTFRLRPIYYNFDKYNIRPDAALVLEELLQTLHENPNLKIELASHTDCRGTTEYNENLSQKRAQSVVDYLVSKGIARDRMIAKGYGESRLINRCKDGEKCSEAEHQENRRTEFTVLSW